MRKEQPQRVLVSFIGKGALAPANEPRTYTGYRSACYAFSDPEYTSEETSLFGNALIWYMRDVLRTPVERWLVLGSPQSNWDALIETVPSEEREDPEISKTRSELEKAIREEERNPSPEGSNKVTQSLLDEWSLILSNKLSPLRVECYLVGWSETTRQQIGMWQVLNSRLDRVSELVLDVTHGFRHQPMLLAAMVVLLSYTRGFGKVSFYYALDMQTPPAQAEAHSSQSKQRLYQVLKIDLFHELLEYIRRLGVLHIAGDYESLGKYILRNQPELKKQLEQIAFMERANLNVQRDRVDEYIERLNQWEPEDVLRGSFKQTLMDQISKRTAATPWERMALRADEADKHHDYLTAYTLLWEAIVSVSVLLIEPSKIEQMDDVELRRKCVDQLLESQHLSKSQITALRGFRAARNWIVHGTQQKNKRAQQALQSSEELRKLYKEAREAFSELLAKIPSSLLNQYIGSVHP